MSSKVQKQARDEHGTMQSYFVGFFLSLVFSIIPYYLVVTKTVSGTALLATILAFAVIQMTIQIFFFLHLGRGPKPLYNVSFFVSTIGIILVVVLGSIFIMNNLHYNMSSGEVTTKLAQDEGIAQIGGAKTGACQGIKAHLEVTIKNGIAAPLHTNANLCDSLTFINTDDNAHDIIFGSRPQSVQYGGVYEISVHKGYAKTITLNKSGSYQFYDKLEPAMSGDFTVAP